jgi:hypothetical protein
VLDSDNEKFEVGRLPEEKAQLYELRRDWQKEIRD